MDKDNGHVIQSLDHFNTTPVQSTSAPATSLSISATPVASPAISMPAISQLSQQMPVPALSKVHCLR